MEAVKANYPNNLFSWLNRETRDFGRFIDPICKSRPAKNIFGMLAKMFDFNVYKISFSINLIFG